MALGPAQLRALLRDVRGCLSFQGTLGLTGLDVERTLLAARPPTGAPRGAPKHSRLPEPKATAAAGPPQPASDRAPGDQLPPSSLQEVRDTLGACQRCALHAGRTSIVFGVGDPKATLMLVGEAPGRDEDLLGEPFVGEAGQLLDRMLHAMGLHRGQVYIANIIKCRPPKNRYPHADEVAECSPFVRQQIRAVAPQVVVAFGRLAAHTLLGTQAPLGDVRGKWQDLDGVAVMPTYHPAYLLRVPKDKALVWRDLQQVMGRLGLRRI